MTNLIPDNYGPLNFRNSSTNNPVHPLPCASKVRWSECGFWDEPASKHKPRLPILYEADEIQCCNDWDQKKDRQKDDPDLPTSSIEKSSKPFSSYFGKTTKLLWPEIRNGENNV